MSRLRDFINREKTYIWLLIFILVINALILFSPKSEIALKQRQMHKAEEDFLKEEYLLTPEKLQILLREKKEVITAMNFLILLIMLFLILGLILDVYLIFKRSKEKIFFGVTKAGVVAGWNLWDVCKAVILFLFFGYILIVIEASLAQIFPLIKESGHIRMMINSSILDSLIIIFVLYTVLIGYKNSLKELGLSLSNFFRNIFIGITGYIAALPMIFGTLVFAIWFAKLINYEPPLEPLLKLFLEEENVAFLLYSTIFVTIFGPIFEEIFFRGFMYSALKKRIGIFGAVIISSILFSLLHTNVVGFLPIMALGILLTYLYEKTGSLTAPIIVHIIHNTGMMSFVFLIKELKM